MQNSSSKDSNVQAPELGLTNCKTVYTATYQITCILIILFFVLLIFCFAYLTWRYKKKYIQIKNTQIPEFFTDSPTSSCESVSDPNRSDYINVFKRPAFAKYNRSKYEIQNYTLDNHHVLGSGHMAEIVLGRVYKEDQELTVAAKRLRLSALNSLVFKKQKLQELIHEIKILSHLGSHKHVIELIGVSTSELRKNQLIMFLEFCEGGPLDKVLQNFRKKYPYSCCSKSIEDDKLIQFLQWAYEMADGMAYISSKKVIHGDLALRNILLTAENHIKISDFGISHFIPDTERVYYRSFLIPWRWSAPEVLDAGEYSVKSDVWAFGVAIWELFTLGELPYSTISGFDEFEKDLKNGHRLYRPKYASTEIYNMMMDCWQYPPNERPDFVKLKERINSEETEFRSKHANISTYLFIVKEHTPHLPELPI